MNRYYCSTYILGAYIAEIADAFWRNRLGTFQTVGLSIGFLLGYITCAYVNWRLAKLILGSLITLPAGFLMLLLHETPHWLVKSGRIEDARYEEKI